MKRLLFDIQSYPSFRSANSYCDQNIIDHLIQDGKYEVHVFAAQYNRQSKEEIIDGVFVHRWRRGFFWRKYTETLSNPRKAYSVIVSALYRFLLRCKQFLTIPVFPFVEPFTIRRSYRSLESLFNRIHFDCVISEHHGLETLYSGYLLKKKHPEIVFLPIFWDSLSGGFRQKYLPKSFIDRRKKRLEKKILECCDYAIMMESSKNHIIELWGQTTLYRKIHLLQVPYFSLVCNNDQTSVSKDHNGPIWIVFAGNMWERDPSFFFKLVSLLSVDEQRKIRISFFTKKEFHPRILEIAKDVQSVVECNDYIPHEKLKKVLSQADVLLNFGVKNPNAISGKVFEYIGYKSKIISTYSIDGEAATIPLKEYPNAFLIDERRTDTEIVAEELSDFLFRVPVQIISDVVLRQKYYASMPEAYVDLIDKIMVEDKRRNGQ